MRISRRLLLTTLCIGLLAALLLPLAVSAPGGGKGKPGAEEPPPPPLPPIEYQIKYFFPPTPSLFSNLNDMNNWGDCVGYYETADGERHAWLYNSTIDRNNPNTAIDLNDIGAVGVPDGCIIASAVGINDFGAIVGYVTLLGDLAVRRGYVLDTSVDPPEFSLLPDNDESWVDTYARRINENGDILGSFQRADGTWGAYLFNPGLYGPADTDVEVIDVNLRSLQAVDLNNPSEAVPAEVVGTVEGDVAFVYTRGIGIEFLPYDRPVFSAYINDAGTICGSIVDEVEVKFHGNKTELVKQRFLFRDSGTLKIFNDSGDDGLKNRATGINSQGTILTWGGFVYQDDWGFVDVDSLVTGTEDDVIEWFSGGGMGGNPKFNDVGPLGFGQVAGTMGFSDGSRGFFILTPKEIPIP